MRNVRQGAIEHRCQTQQEVVEVDRLEAGVIIDNPASARVLEKLGFEPVGIVAPRMSCARGMEVPARLMRLQLSARAKQEEALAA